MSNFSFKKWRVIRGEEKASKHINILSHYADDTLLDKSGKLIKIFKLSGLNFNTKGNHILDTYKIRRNNLFKSFSSDFACYTWQIRRKVNQYPEGEFDNQFAQEINNRYRKKVDNNSMFHTELYLALITKQPEGFINRSFSLLKHLSLKFDKKAKQDYLAKRYADLNDVTQKVLHSLADYNCQLLTVYIKENEKFSEPLSFLYEIINFDKFEIPLEVCDAGSILPRKRLFFNNRSGTIELRSANSTKKFSAMLSIKAYSSRTHQGILDTLGALKFEYVITQSFRFYDRHVAKGRMRDQQNEMLQSKEESISQTEQIDEAYDDAASGEVGYGKHHLTVAIYADTQEELNKNVGQIVSLFADVDIIAVREDIACELGFWAQLPGNFGYVARLADISTKNFAGFSSFHNYPIGKLIGNHWGDALTVFETLSGSPYYFNFHYKDVGNFLVFGAMGAGKTVLVGFLILQSMKFGGKRIIFDKDRGLEILVRALGGRYERLKPGIRTGFNPCQLEDTPENRKFLSVLFRKILTINGDVLSERDTDVIEHAIEGMYRLDKPSRQLCHIASFFGTAKLGSLRTRFDAWHSDGPQAWLFDNADDSLNLNADVLGFDLGNILQDGTCKTPALMYLTYRVEEAIAGERGILFCDEGWRFLIDDYFRELINNWSRTPRKLNNIFGLATQVVNDTVDLSLSKAINESAFCKIIFPNPSADKKVYIDDLGLTDAEYNQIKTLPDDQHYFLLNHGRGIYKESVVLRLNLTGFKDLIAVLSAREETLKLLDQLLLEIGEDCNDWLPIFLSRIST
jgi:type IV secretion system protein VirB4